MHRYGTPAEAGAAIVADPGRAPRRLLPHIGDPRGQRIANPLGSHGRIAVALSVLGADVTVFDLSASNARYARELALEAGVAVEYVVGDLLATAPLHRGRFDAVVMELGVVHYFVEIERFVTAIGGLLQEGGRVVLNEFHPLARKSIGVRDGAPTFDGDYFDAGLQEARTPYEVFVEDEIPACTVRRWTLGEIVSAFAGGGFRVERLIEHPAPGLPSLPGTFTLVATAPRSTTVPEPT